MKNKSVFKTINIIIFGLFLASCSKTIPNRDGYTKGGGRDKWIESTETSSYKPPSSSASNKNKSVGISNMSPVYVPDSESNLDSKPEPKVTPNYNNYIDGFTSTYTILDGNRYPVITPTFGKVIPYLQPVNELYDGNYNLKSYNEPHLLDFYKDLNVKGYGDDSRYWRWKTSTSKSSLYKSLPSKISQIYSSNKKNVLTLSNGEWLSKPLNRVGNVQKIEVGTRSASGMISHLIVKTDSGTFLILKEYNIRKLLATKTNVYGAKSGSNYADKPLMSSASTLPSASLAFEERDGNINIYGAGFGHGVGMPQAAAGDLGLNHGMDYKNILYRYYSNTEIVDINTLSQVSSNLKVGITNGNGNLDHSSVKLQSEGQLKIIGEGVDYTVNPNTSVSFKRSGSSIVITAGSKSFTAYNSINIGTVNSNDLISIVGLKRNYSSSPSYRGFFNISISRNSGLRITNIVDIEEYLMQVVSSEMSKRYGLEALKAQAVASRTYAVNALFLGKYKKEGIDVKDNVESQVYNNQIENEETEIAVRETRGQILVYEGMPIQSIYFSTSSGSTEAAHNVW